MENTKEQYLVRGALLYCDQGSHPRRLNLLQCHGVYVGNNPMIHQEDCKFGQNISYFGVCNSQTPPNNANVIRLAGHVPEGSEATVTDVQGLQCQATIIGSWRSVKQETNISGNFPAVTTNSYLVCNCGGLIQPLTSGQEFVDAQDIQHLTNEQKWELWQQKESLDNNTKTQLEYWFEKLPWSVRDKMLSGLYQPNSKKSIEIAPWLTGYTGKPTSSGGRSVTYSSEDRQKSRDVKDNPGIDWYSYENQSEKNQFTEPYLKNRDFIVGPEGELFDENGYYWITLGPKVLIPDYPDNGKLQTDEFADYIGCRVDVILRDIKRNEYIYLECVYSGNIKAHTLGNGIYQTGHPYPNSSVAKKEPYEPGYVDGSIIEFTGAKPSTNGTMSNYIVEEIIVYPKSKEN